MEVEVVAPDVIVVGLGSMGAATAYQLASRGVRVLGLDRFTPPHGRGAHAGGSRIIRLAYAEGAEYVPLVRRAYELWAAVQESAGVELITRTGGLMIGPLDGSIVGGALASARTHDLAHEVWEPDEVHRRFPAFTLAGGDVGLYEEVAGLLRPEAAIGAYLHVAQQAGAELRYGVPVTGWRASADGVSVDTPDGTITAGRLVVCPGAWAPELLADLAIPLVVHRRIQHYWSPPSADYTLGRMPIWIWDYGPGTAAYGLPATGTGADATRGVKAALHHGIDPADPDAGAADATSAEVDAMRTWLSTRIPALAAAEWLGAKPCLYTLTPDEHFVLGRHPMYDTVAVAGGFSGHGFKFVPVVGEILADLVTTGSTPHPIDLFAPDRFARERRG